MGEVSSGFWQIFFLYSIRNSSWYSFLQNCFRIFFLHSFTYSSLQEFLRQFLVELDPGFLQGLRITSFKNQELFQKKMWDPSPGFYHMLRMGIFQMLFTQFLQFSYRTLGRTPSGFSLGNSWKNPR